MYNYYATIPHVSFSLYWISRVWTYWCEQTINPYIFSMPWLINMCGEEKKRKEDSAFLYIYWCACVWTIKVSIPCNDNLHLLSVYSLNEREKKHTRYETETSWNHETYYYQGSIFNQSSIYFSYNEFILGRGKRKD